MRTAPKALLSLAAAGVLATSLTACGSKSNSSTASQTGAASSSAAAGPVATIPNLTGKMTSVKLDAGFVKALTTLKLTPGVVGKATLTDGSLNFPITSGNATYYKPGTKDPYVTGTINHEGSGLSLSAGGTKVELTNFVVDPGTSKLMGDVSANGKSVVKGAYLFFLDGSNLQPLMVDKTAGTATLTGTKVEVSPDAAMLLDKTFMTTAVTPNFLVGVATITLALPKS